MQSIQVDLKDILNAIHIFSKKEEKGDVLTIYRPDFNVWHRIPGIKHNWSPTKIQIDKEVNSLKVWRLTDGEKPSVVVTHVLHDEQGYSEVSGLSANDMKHIDAPVKKRKSKKRKKLVPKPPKAKAQKEVTAVDTFE